MEELGFAHGLEHGIHEFVTVNGAELVIDRLGSLNERALIFDNSNLAASRVNGLKILLLLSISLLGNLFCTIQLAAGGNDFAQIFRQTHQPVVVANRQRDVHIVAESAVILLDVHELHIDNVCCGVVLAIHHMLLQSGLNLGIGQRSDVAAESIKCSDRHIGVLNTHFQTLHVISGFDLSNIVRKSTGAQMREAEDIEPDLISLFLIKLKIAVFNNI